MSILNITGKHPLFGLIALLSAMSEKSNRTDNTSRQPNSTSKDNGNNKVDAANHKTSKEGDILTPQDRKKSNLNQHKPSLNNKKENSVKNLPPKDLLELQQTIKAAALALAEIEKLIGRAITSEFETTRTEDCTDDFSSSSEDD